MTSGKHRPFWPRLAGEILRICKGHLDRIEIAAGRHKTKEARASAGDEQPQQSLSKESSA
jgi:hypothetical protein